MTTATTRTSPRRRTMSAWRLEWLRITRARGGLVLLAVYAFFGLAGPLTARFMQQLVKYASTDLTIIAPAPIPAHGIVNFVNQATQTGLIGTVVVAAAALCFDARLGSAVFYRTRAAGQFALIWPRFVSSCGLAAVAYALGTAVACVETGLLIGPLPTAAVLAGVALQTVYLVFAIAVVAFASTLVRSTLSTVGISIAVLFLVLPVIGLAPIVGRWLPSRLATAPAALVTDGSAADYLQALLVSVAATVGLLALAVRRGRRRDL
jgi:ABC-2 type transport system permease protein